MGLQAVGAYIQGRRKKAGLTQEDVARSLGVSKQTVSEWERGKFRPGSQFLARLNRIIDADPDEIQDLMLDDSADAAEGRRRAETPRATKIQVESIPSSRDPEVEAILDEIEEELKFSTQAKIVLRALLDSWREGREGREGTRRTSEG